jgi:hypothetical protein
LPFDFFVRHGFITLDLVKPLAHRGQKLQSMPARLTIKNQPAVDWCI